MSDRQKFWLWTVFAISSFVALGSVALRIFADTRDKQILLHEPSIAYAAYRCLTDNKIIVDINKVKN